MIKRDVKRRWLVYAAVLLGIPWVYFSNLAWSEEPVHQESSATTDEGEEFQEDEIFNRIKGVHVEKVHFDEVPISQVVDFIRKVLEEQGMDDINIQDLSSRFNDGKGGAAGTKQRVSFSAKDFDLLQLLEEVCEAADCSYVIDKGHIKIYSKKDPRTIIRTWKGVPPALLDIIKEAKLDKKMKKFRLWAVKKRGEPCEAGIQYNSETKVLKFEGSPENQQLMDEMLRRARDAYVAKYGANINSSTNRKRRVVHIKKKLDKMSETIDNVVNFFRDMLDANGENSPKQTDGSDAEEAAVKPEQK